MTRTVALALAASLGCAALDAEAPPPTEEPPASAPGGAVFRGAALARVRCVLLAPVENASSTPAAGDAATAALAAGVDPAHARVFPVSDLRAMFRGTPLELPAGIPPSLALELAEIVGADAALYGSIEGRAGPDEPGLLVTVRLSLTGSRQVVFARTETVHPEAGERAEVAVRRAVASMARPMLSRIGGAGSQRACFDAERTRALHRYAAAQGRLERSAPAQVMPASVRTAQPRTRRQTEWARKLGAGGRVVVEDVAFAGRSATLQRDGGLADLAIALAASPDTKIRLEAFVDATSDRRADASVSSAMSRAAGERLVQLGVDRERIASVGRGGERPLLPNFTARGRAANRRIEAVALR